MAASPSASPVSSQRSSLPHKPFKKFLLSKLHTPEPARSEVEFTADTNREAPCENIKYQRKTPVDRSTHCNASYKLVHRKSRSDADLTQSTQPSHTPDMMNLLKQVVEVGVDPRAMKNRCNAMVKVLQTTPPRKTQEMEKKVRGAVQRKEKGETVYVPRPKNAFVIQPKVPIPVDTKPETPPKSRAEHRWQWKGRHGLPPQSSPKSSSNAVR